MRSVSVLAPSPLFLTGNKHRTNCLCKEIFIRSCLVTSNNFFVLFCFLCLFGFFVLLFAKIILTYRLPIYGEIRAYNWNGNKSLIGASALVIFSALHWESGVLFLASPPTNRRILIVCSTLWCPKFPHIRPSKQTRSKQAYCPVLVPILHWP